MPSSSQQWAEAASYTALTIANRNFSGFFFARRRRSRCCPDSVCDTLTGQRALQMQPSAQPENPRLEAAQHSSLVPITPVGWWLWRRRRRRFRLLLRRRRARARTHAAAEGRFPAGDGAGGDGDPAAAARRAPVGAGVCVLGAAVGGGGGDAVGLVPDGAGHDLRHRQQGGPTQVTAPSNSPPPKNNPSEVTSCPSTE